MSFVLRKLLAASCVFLLSACAGISKVETGGAVKVGSNMLVTSSGAWNRYDGGFFDIERSYRDNIPTWTKDGLALDALRFIPGVASGASIVPIQSAKVDKDRFIFRASMTGTDLVRLVERYFALDGSVVNQGPVRPATFGGFQGVASEFSYTRVSDGLSMKVAVWLVVQDQKLYGVLYSAPALGFFDRGISDVRAIASSVQITK